MAGCEILRVKNHKVIWLCMTKIIYKESAEGVGKFEDKIIIVLAFSIVLS